MKVTATPDDGGSAVVLCDYGQTESSELGGGFEDLVEQLSLWKGRDAVMLHRGQRLVSVNFSGRHEAASYAAAEAYVLELLRDFPRTTCTVAFAASTNGGSTVLATITMTDAVVQLTSFRVVGVLILMQWAVRGALVEPSS